MSKFNPWQYWAKPTRIIDGDTMEVTLDSGRRNYQEKVTVRLAGIDTPEMNRRTSWLDDHEYSRALGLHAKNVLRFLCPPGEWIPIETIKDRTGSFERLLAFAYYHAPSDFSSIATPHSHYWGLDDRLFVEGLTLAGENFAPVSRRMVNLGLARPYFDDAETDRLREEQNPPRSVSDWGELINSQRELGKHNE